MHTREVDRKKKIEEATKNQPLTGEREEHVLASKKLGRVKGILWARRVLVDLHRRERFPLANRHR